VHEKCAKRLELTDAWAQTEVTTGTGRIDVLISDRESAIIIENKIYHWLGNDLLEYWHHVHADEAKKVGVLLTLNPHPIPEDARGKYINITHIEWIRAVKQRLEDDTLPPNYRVYVNDFIQTIENLTTTYEMNDAAKFYFQHADQVLNAQKTMNEAHSFLQNQFQLIADSIGWQTFGNSLEWRNFWDEHNRVDTYLTILTKDLLEGKMRYTLILELFREDKKRAQELREFLADHPQTKDKKRGEEKVHLHFLYKDYSVDEAKLANLAEDVVKNIRNDFADMTLKAIRKLHPDKDISAWESKFTGQELKEP
jgi:hypothetical protein